MANIESKLTVIKSASGGEDVRDAIIGALRDINNDVPADMSNPVQIVEDMPQGTDLTIPLNPPKLVSQILIKQPGSGGKSTTLNDITITENGEYPTDDEGYDPDEENRYYKKVTVKVPQLANAVMDLEEEITQNGTYSAPADWGVDGIRTFTVNVSGASGDGPFQVDFYDKPQSDPTASVIYTELVPKGGNAEFHGTAPTSDIGPLTGWNPSPINVTRDLKCYPKFGQIVVDPTEISDDWTVICANHGEPYPIGSHKLLAYGATFTADEVKTWNPSYTGDDIAYNIYMMMYKVGFGEGNSHSSWISSIVANTQGNVQGAPAINNIMDWSYEDNAMRKFLNGPFFNHMADIFKNNIVPVTKYSIDMTGIAVPTEDRIWIPGFSEIGTYQTKDPNDSRYDFTASENWSGVYVDCISILDSVSMKYVRDFLNNDRDWFINNFMALYNGTIVNNTSISLRDNYDYRYHSSHRSAGYLKRYPYIECANDDNTRFNFGFCL